MDLGKHGPECCVHGIRVVNWEVLLIFPKVVQVGFHVSEVQVIRTCPEIDEFGDPSKTRRVASAFASFDTAFDKEIAVDELVQKRRNEQPSVVLFVLENWVR